MNTKVEDVLCSRTCNKWRALAVLSVIITSSRNPRSFSNNLWLGKVLKEGQRSSWWSHCDHGEMDASRGGRPFSCRRFILFFVSDVSINFRSRCLVHQVSGSQHQHCFVPGMFRDCVSLSKLWQRWIKRGGTLACDPTWGKIRKYCCVCSPRALFVVRPGRLRGPTMACCRRRCDIS